MPILKNAKHERFAQLVAKGLAASNAYKESGYTAEGNAAESAACRLLRNVQIVARVEELKQLAADLAVATIGKSKADVMRALWENHVLARASGEYSASNKALELTGKEMAMFIERKRIGPMDLADLTPEELDQLANQLEQLERNQAEHRGSAGDARPETSVSGPGGVSTH